MKRLRLGKIPIKHCLFLIQLLGCLLLILLYQKNLNSEKKNFPSHKSLTKEDTGSLIKDNFDKYEVFMAAGGDGTVHTVATELVGSKRFLEYCHWVRETDLQRNLDLK